MVKNKLRDYIIENFLYGDGAELTDSDSLLDKGVIDSTGILELVSFVETEYQFDVDDLEIKRENFDSIENLSVFIESKQQQMN